MLHSKEFLSHRRDDTVSRSAIVAPAIRDAVGHHLNTARGLSFVAQCLGHEPVWLGHKHLDTSLIPDYVTLVPAFSSTIYENQIGLLGRAVRPLITDRLVCSCC